MPSSTSTASRVSIVLWPGFPVGAECLDVAKASAAVTLAVCFGFEVPSTDSVNIHRIIVYCSHGGRGSAGRSEAVNIVNVAPDISVSKLYISFKRLEHKCFCVCRGFESSLLICSDCSNHLLLVNDAFPCFNFIHEVGSYHVDNHVGQVSHSCPRPYSSFACLCVLLCFFCFPLHPFTALCFPLLPFESQALPKSPFDIPKPSEALQRLPKSSGRSSSISDPFWSLYDHCLIYLYCFTDFILLPLSTINGFCPSSSFGSRYIS